MRIVSLCPSNTELLAYLGRLDDVAAVDDSSDWPPEVKQLPKVGPDLHIDMDQVEALKPDLVVASLSVPGMERNVKELKRRGLPHLVLAPNSLDDIANDLLRLGEALGETKKAAELVRRYHDVLDWHRERAASAEPARLYWEWWPRPVFTPGGANWLSELSELAGGRNIFSDIPQASVQTEWDDVLARNPSHILLVWVGVQNKKNEPESRHGAPECPTGRGGPHREHPHFRRIALLPPVSAPLGWIKKIGAAFASGAVSSR